MSDDEQETADPETQAQRLEEKVEVIRGNLDGLVGELDRRRHRLTGAAKRALPYAAAAVGAVGLAIGGVLIWRRQRAQRPSRARRLLTELRAIAQHPDRLSRKEKTSVTKKIVAAAGAAAASVLARRLAETLASRRSAQARRGVSVSLQ